MRPLRAGRGWRGIFSARSALQCVAEWGISRVGYRHARVQLIFFVSFRRHARGERFLIEAAVPVCVLKANGTILFFLRRYRSVRGLLICSTTAKHNGTCHYHKGQEHPRGPSSTKGGNCSLRCHLSLPTKTGSGQLDGQWPSLLGLCPKLVTDLLRASAITPTPRPVAHPPVPNSSEPGVRAELRRPDDFMMVKRCRS